MRRIVLASLAVATAALGWNLAADRAAAQQAAAPAQAKVALPSQPCGTRSTAL